MDDHIKGPRPLSLHISNSAAIWDTVAAAGVKSIESAVWHTSLNAQVQALQSRMNTVDFNLLNTEIIRQAKARKMQFLTGVNNYIRHPYRPKGITAEVCLQLGSVQLHDFGGDGPPILMIPSLINPGYILDLMPGRSLAIFLKEAGYRPLVVNWGMPGHEELRYGLEGYIINRLHPLLQHAAHMASGPVAVLGYCMGGTLSAALTALFPALVRQLVLLAAPWDFKTEAPHPGRHYATYALEQLAKLPVHAALGVDMLQSFFTSVDPSLSDHKFRAYAGGKYQNSEADFFSALEIWANNGPPLSQHVARDCLSSWYQGNAPAAGAWQVAGRTVQPEAITCPVWVAAPKADRLVPQESAFAILKKLKDAKKHEPPSGHIGMVVGGRAREGLWYPLAAWLKKGR